MKSLKAIVIGLGSMGKRRVRCLKALGVNDIVGVDIRQDRRVESQALYGIPTFQSLSAALIEIKPDMAIISLPPKSHCEAMEQCVNSEIPFFVEASVVDDGLDQIIKSVRERQLPAAPSATLHFHPAIKEIFRIVRTGLLGKVSNVMLHSGQYLPDWHTYESVSDYYVSDPETGGAREIVPFEMTWLTELFGFPSRVAGNFRKTIDISGASKISDTYNCILDYQSFLAIVTVDVVSRHATRRLLINGDQGQLIWSWDDKKINVYSGPNSTWTEFKYEMENSAPGYNENIGENMYIEEVGSFIEFIHGREEFPNTLEKDQSVLKLLYAIELSDQSSKFINI